MERNPLIVIQFREDGKDGPRRSLADRSGVPVIVQSWRRAMEAGLGCVIVDTTDPVAGELMVQAGAYVFASAPDDSDSHNYRTPSGAERLAAAVNKFDRFYNHDVIINVRDDQPDLDPRLIRALMYPLADLDIDIATVVSPIGMVEAASEEVVKVDVVLQERRRVHVLTKCTVGEARSFSRTPSDIVGPPFYRHEPIYAYKRASLDRFVRAEPTLRELEDRLEPMRAIEHGMRIGVVMIAADQEQPQPVHEHPTQSHNEKE